jgi:hypothetical protein
VTEAQTFLVGVHFRRYFGGPGRVRVEPGQIVLTDRKATRTLIHTGPVVTVERKRFEPPTGNHWIELTDGTVTAHVAVSRKRAERVLAAITACGFEVHGP